MGSDDDFGPPLDAIWETPIGSAWLEQTRIDRDEWPATPERANQLRSMPYEKYLATPEWGYRRREMVKAAERKCGRCGRYSPNLDVHHLTYERLGNELPEDLIVLCHDCHSLEHGVPS
jgi:5-methylcytosine-specific restriction endonuclease McrA